MWRGRRDGRRWRNIRCVGKCALPSPRSSYLFPSLFFSLPLSPLPCLANLNSDHRPAPPFVPSSGRSKDPRKPKLRKKGRKKEKSGERGRGRAFQRVFRMKSRPNEVRKLPNGEASSLLLVGSKWRGKKCRLAVAFVATGEWRTRGELRAVNRVAPSLLLTSELDGSGWFVELGLFSDWPLPFWILTPDVFL